LPFAVSCKGLYPHVDIWVPAVFDPESLNPKYRWYVGYMMLARLAPGVNLQRAQAGMETAAANFNRGTFDQYHVEVRSLMDEEGWRCTESAVPGVGCRRAVAFIESNE